MTTEPYQPSAELAPSAVAADEPSFARFLGATGSATALLGVIAIIANQFGPRWVSTSGGYFLAALGFAAMLYHALRDDSPEIRRFYNAAGVLLAVLALVAAFAPGPMFSDVSKTTGYHLIPWTPVFALLALAFLAAPLSRETDGGVRNLILILFLVVSTVLCVGAVHGGMVKPELLVGSGIFAALVGLAYLFGFLAHNNNDEGIGFFVAAGLGVVGAIALTYALARSIWPSVLTDGPAALLNAYQRTDYWKVAARVMAILVSLGIAFWGVRAKRMSMPMRGGLAAFGLSFAGVFLYASFQVTSLPAKEPFLIPSGLLLMLIGALYLGVSLAVVSDHPFVALVRRELASYFLSPIGYLVILGIAFLTWFGYWLFLDFVTPSPTGDSAPLDEPILQMYIPGTFIGPFCVLMLVPAITMRIFSEEKRSGALEVLLTAPIGEFTIVASKVFAAWLFYMVCWIPMGLYLIALRVEGGVPFDYRPLLSLYIAIGASGFAFMAMGAFFSSLTKNQIVAAAMTFVVLLVLFVMRWHTIFPTPLESLRSAIAAVASASYWPLWAESLKGQLLVRDLILQLSMGVFWMFLTLKSLEARKWG